MRMLRAYLPFQLREGSIDEKNRSAEFVASTERAVSMGPWEPEVLRMAGCRLRRYQSNPVLLDSHDRTKLSSVIGSTEVRIEGRQLISRHRYADTQAGEDAWKLVKGGHVRAVSIGYSINEKKVRKLRQGETDGEGEGKVEGPANVVNDWELLEVSQVAVPADEDAVRRELKTRAAIFGEEVKKSAKRGEGLAPDAEADLDNRGNQSRYGCPACGHVFKPNTADSKGGVATCPECEEVFDLDPEHEVNDERAIPTECPNCGESPFRDREPYGCTKHTNSYVCRSCDWCVLGGHYSDPDAGGDPWKGDESNPEGRAAKDHFYCESCGEQFWAEGEDVTCPECGSSAVEMGSPPEDNMEDDDERTEDKASEKETKAAVQGDQEHGEDGHAKGENAADGQESGRDADGDDDGDKGYRAGDDMTCPHCEKAFPLPERTDVTTEPSGGGNDTDVIKEPAKGKAAKVVKGRILPLTRVAKGGLRALELLKRDIAAITPRGLEHISEQAILEGCRLEQVRARLLKAQARRMKPLGTPSLEREPKDTVREIPDEVLVRSLENLGG